ncbi:DUF3885 domain-containing protein [Planomicrobium stackebrandtii]|uniref:DUF3885 domain-containing protein n=1 Tax=Planomicrobium stackebrandtii TaxID=253160 RepID=UPI00389B35F8
MKFVFFEQPTSAFHLYDDRDCDILAADKEDIRFLYNEYNEWILNYDRKEIGSSFSVK